MCFTVWTKYVKDSNWNVVAAILNHMCWDYFVKDYIQYTICMYTGGEREMFISKAT